MKSLLGDQKFFIALLVLALAQFACNFGAQPSPQPSAQPSIAGPQQTPSSEPQATQSPTVVSSERGTPDEAQAMLQKAVEHYNLVGRAQALENFTGRVAPFFDRDLYVACIDSHLIQTANGGFPNLVGSSVEPLSRSAWDSASNNNISLINYSYLDPVTKKE